MPDLTPTHEAVAQVEEAINAIEQFVSIPSGSPFREDLELLRAHDHAFTKGETFTNLYGAGDLRPFFRRQVGAIDFSKRILGLKQAGDLGSFKEALGHFVDAGVSPASPMTDYDSLGEKAQHHTRLLFEFYIASGITLNSGQLATLAGGKDTSQKNPDVALANLPIGGIACKMVKCKNYMTILDRIMDGAAQIEASTCSNGLVALDVRACVDQELLTPFDGSKYRTFTSEEQAQIAQDAIFYDIAENIKRTMIDTHAESYLEKTRRQGFIIAAQSFSIIETAHGPVPFNMNKAYFVPIVLVIGTTDDMLPRILKDELQCSQWIAITPPI